MHVSRIGFSPLKGARHQAHDAADLALDGPVGDRRFCLVDPATARVLRTIENPSIVAVRATYASGVLSLAFPDGTLLTAPTADSGEDLKADYWGRPALLRLQDGPHAALLARHLGRPVALARVEPGEVVYSGAVTLVGTAELRELAARAGRPALAHEAARFRPTLTVDGEAGLDALAAGTLLHVGRATLRVRGGVPRCAVADVDPVTGVRNVPVMRTLGGYRRGSGEVWFGLDAEVVAPGLVRTGDPVAVEA